MLSLPATLSTLSAPYVYTLRLHALDFSARMTKLLIMLIKDVDVQELANDQKLWRCPVDVDSLEQFGERPTFQVSWLSRVEHTNKSVKAGFDIVVEQNGATNRYLLVPASPICGPHLIAVRRITIDTKCTICKR